MPDWREIPDRRERLSGDRVRLWYDLGAGRLRSCTTVAYGLSAETIERIGKTLAAEGAHPRPRLYGDGER